MYISISATTSRKAGLTFIIENFFGKPVCSRFIGMELNPADTSDKSAEYRSFRLKMSLIADLGPRTRTSIFFGEKLVIVNPEGILSKPTGINMSVSSKEAAGRKK